MKLGEVCKIVMGQSPKGDTYNHIKNGSPLLNGPTEFGAQHPNCTLWTTSPKKMCQIGDLIFCVRGSTTGRMNWADQPYCLGRGVGAFRAKTNEPTDTTFIFYQITMRLKSLLSLSNGSVFPNLNANDFNDFDIDWPNSQNRLAIASVLGALDDKIENNCRMNETLEEMARAIFKSWFVDFDPVHAKAAGNAPAHMNVETAALFPSSFGEDGLPEGWDNKTLGDVCKITSGKRPPTKMTAPDSENNISVYGGNGIAWYTNEVLFEPPFIITGRVGTLGTVYRVYEECWVSDNALCCFPSNKDAFELIYFAMKEIDYQSLNSGSTQPLLTQTALKTQNIIAPSKEVASAFHQNTEILFEKILVNDEENQTLAQLRDTLLPKLMSGEIRVKDAEQEVEAAV